MFNLYSPSAMYAQGDKVRAPAIRRVQNVSSTGSTESHRVRLNLTVEVTKVEWAPATSAGESGATADASNANNAQPSTAGLSISGPVVVENQYVRLGAFHTLDIEVNRNIRIEKTNGWDSVALDRINESCLPGRGAEVAAVVCSEGTRSTQHKRSGSPKLQVMIRHSDILPSISTYDRHLTKARSPDSKKACRKLFGT